jgi:hypothetical protein
VSDNDSYIDRLIVVDHRFAYLLDKHKWSIGSQGYAVSRIDGKRVYMHRLVWKLNHPMRSDAMLDHINGNKLDNRICNLRPATGSLNCRSRLRSGGGRLPEGVQPKPGSRPFVSHISVYGRTLYLGSHFTVGDASRVYEHARSILLKAEAIRARGGSRQPDPPASRTPEKAQWNLGWRAILLCPDSDRAVLEAVAFANEFVPRTEASKS